MLLELIGRSPGRCLSVRELCAGSLRFCGLHTSKTRHEDKTAAIPAPPVSTAKPELVCQLLSAKEKSGKSFSQIAQEVGLTNVYTAQLFYNQQQLQPGTVAALRRAVPDLTDDQVAAMQRAPMRSFDPRVLQEPSVYRLYEAITHNGEAIKALINEKCGDGIMSAIGFYATVDKVTGKEGEPRVVITFNGKFLPFVEQRVEDNVTQRGGD